MGYVERKKIFMVWLGFGNGSVKESNIQRLNLVKREEFWQAIKDMVLEYKWIPYDSDIPLYRECLNEIRYQNLIYEEIHSSKIANQTIRNFSFISKEDDVRIGKFIALDVD